jgi:hypothetical protein
MTQSRHQWGDPNRFLYKTERVCLRCDLVKVTRHEPASTWIEWWRDGERINAARTPGCVAAAASRLAETLAPQHEGAA